MAIGKQIRLNTWFKDGKTFLLPLDEVIPRGLSHSFVDYGNELTKIVNSSVDGIVIHSGIATRFGQLLAGQCPWIAKLTTNSNYVPDQTIRGRIGSVKQALILGASGVALNVFIGSQFEKEHLSFLAECVEAGEKWGMPVIAFMDPPKGKEFDPEALAYVGRIGAEIGADIIKTNYTGSAASFKYVVDNTMAPVLIEYSPLPETAQGTHESVKGAMEAGGAGVHMGKRVLYEEKTKMITAIGNTIRQFDKID